MTRSERYEAFIEQISDQELATETELRYQSPFQLLVAVVLSAQCTDKRVNQVTGHLFEDFPGPEHMSQASFEELWPYIKSISYPNNKTKHLIGLSQKLLSDFQGEVPGTREDLQSLPGVGRKTANVILNVLFDQPTMAVDTHVYRVSKRLGLVAQNAKTPLEVEKRLIKSLPKDQVARADQWLILHGRYTCVARKPNCLSCSCTHFCRHFEKKILPSA